MAELGAYTGSKGKALIYEKKEPRPTQRIGIITAVTMVGLALILDGLQDIFLLFNLLPVVGSLIDVVFSWFIAALSTIIFGIWFFLCGVSYTDRHAAQKMLIIISSVVVELIPIVDALPAITFGVVALIVQTRLEDSGISTGNIAAIGGPLKSLKDG